MECRLVLASTSPRRAQLLQEGGFTFEVVAPDVEEAHDPSLTCEDLTMENARRKAIEGARLRPDALVIGADTLVYIHGHPLSKPTDMTEACSMLRRLAGKTHQVCTGVALAWEGGTKLECFAVITQVTFKPITETDIKVYHSLVNVLDKAGGYAVQEHGEMLVKGVDGSLTNVIGLPMEALAERLAQRQA